jgi:hypothetical protein
MEPTEEYTALRPAPEGCIAVTVIAPESGLEEVFQGTVEPVVINGVSNCQAQSRAELKGPEERNGFDLTSIFGKGFAHTLFTLKECGFTNQQLLQVGLLPHS